MADMPTQMKIAFPTPQSPLKLGIVLRGLRVVSAPWEGTVEEAVAYLQGVGIKPEVEAEEGIIFPAKQIKNLKNLPKQVTIEPLGNITPIAQLALADLQGPASVTAYNGLTINWFDANGRQEYPLAQEAALALMASELSFVATGEAREIMETMAEIPLQVGKAQPNPDNFIEISTSKPQYLEQEDLPGLFKLNDTHYGISKAYWKYVDENKKIVWETKMPPQRKEPAIPETLEETLLPHLQEDLKKLNRRLVNLEGQVLVYKPGLGKRIVALSALETLDAFDALVVCPPWSLWVWQRNAELLGRKTSLLGDEADIRLITYFDLSRGARLGTYAALVFDDFASHDASQAKAQTALAGLALVDAYRIGITSWWPQDPEQACQLLDLVRPCEFALGTQPLSQRYPVNPIQRAEEHARPYIMKRNEAAESTLRGVRRHQTILVQPHRDQLKNFSGGGNVAPFTKLAAQIETTSAGTGSTISPKITKTVELITPAANLRRRIAVVTRSPRAAALLKAVLANFHPKVTDRDLPDDNLIIYLWQTKLPDLRDFDEVVFLEYPWSAQMIDDCVGSSLTDLGPYHTTVLHCPGTIDDRMAILAAKKKETMEEGITTADINYLLSPRWQET